MNIDIPLSPNDIRDELRRLRRLMRFYFWMTVFAGAAVWLHVARNGDTGWAWLIVEIVAVALNVSLFGFYGGRHATLFALLRGIEAINRVKR